ncbi:MAG: tetratricopeptide repeat protein, partial [Bacteroides sp.]|nr:tetratricopeptide repeat protein [Bacteroides sp.]
KSVINDSRYYKADCLYHLFKDKEALVLMEEHLTHRGRGIESDFSKKEAVLFYKVLKYSHHPKMAKITDEGYASESQRDRISKRIDALEKSKEWGKIVRYLKVICTHYPNEYYLKTILSEYCKTLGNTGECLVYAKDAFAQEPYDPLVKYNYAVALALNGQTDDALAQFEEIVALGADYIAFSEHGEGIRWAKRLLRDAQNYIYKIKH